MKLFIKTHFIRFILLLGTALVFTPGMMISANKKVALDAANIPVYQNINSDTIIAEYIKNPEAAALKYEGRHFAVLGKYKSPGEDNSFSLTSFNPGLKETFECKKTEDFTQEYNPKANDIVWVYGKFSDTNVFNKEIEFQAEAVKKASVNSASEYVFSLINGVSADKDSMAKRTVGNGSFTYYIPEYYEDIEYELPDDLGKQYKLNHLDGKGAPESLFVFYVDDSFLKDKADALRTTEFQKAIVNNICKGSKIRSKNVPFLGRDIDRASIKADYTTFTSYSGNFSGQGSKQSYYMEFMFLPPDKNNGQRCFLYIYDSENHADEILLMLRIALS